MSKKTNHVVPSSSGWAVKKSGSERASRTFETKEKAVEYGRELSRSEKTELYIHKTNGMIQNRNSYGNNPNPLKNKLSKESKLTMKESLKVLHEFEKYTKHKKLI